MKEMDEEKGHKEEIGDGKRKRDQKWSGRGQRTVKRRNGVE